MEDLSMRMMRAWRQYFHFQASEFLSSLFMLECHVYDLIEDFFLLVEVGGRGSGEKSSSDILAAAPFFKINTL